MSMPAHSPISPDSAHPGGPTERPHVSAELQFLLIAIAFVLVMLLAGVPGHERKAGDGSSALRHGWAERHAAEVAAQQAGNPTPSDAPLPAIDSPR
jgi:hypothetical protein